MSETVYPATQRSNPEDCITCIVQRCYFPNCLASPSFLAKDFPSPVTHRKSYAYFIELRETNGGKENTVRVTEKGSISFRLKTMVHESKKILNTKKIRASGLYLHYCFKPYFRAPYEFFPMLDE